MNGKKNARIYAWVAAALLAVLLIWNIFNTRNFFTNLAGNSVISIVQYFALRLIWLAMVVTLLVANREAAAAAFGLRALYQIWTMISSVRVLINLVRMHDQLVSYYAFNTASSLITFWMNAAVALLLLMKGGGGKKKAASLWFLPGVLYVAGRVVFYIGLATIGGKPNLLDISTLMNLLWFAAYLFVGLWIRQMNLSEPEKAPVSRPGQVPLPQGWNPTQTPVYYQGGNPSPAAAPSQNWNPAQGPATSQGWNQNPATASGQSWNQFQTPSFNQSWNQSPAAAPAQNWNPAQGPVYNQGWNPSQAPAPGQNWNPAPAAAPAQNWNPAPAPAQAPSPAPSQDISNEDKLRILKDLADSGVITQEEFETRKKMLGN